MSARRTLRGEDHYRMVWSNVARRHLWVVRHTRPISMLATAFNMYALYVAMKMIESFEALAVDDYAISDMHECSAPSLPTHSIISSLLTKTKSTLHQTDMATELSQCHASLIASGEVSGLKVSRVTYYYLWYGGVALALLLDLVRFCGRSLGIGDLLLGFHSPEREARRLWPALLMMVVPLVHLSFFFLTPLTTPCCTGTPKLDVALRRIRTLAFLLFVSTYCLIGDAHNHGYWLLRIPDSERSSVALLRSKLEKPPPKSLSSETAGNDLLPPAEEPPLPPQENEEEDVEAMRAV